MKEARTPNIIFWGTPEFSLPSLEALFAHDYKVIAVITNPDEPVGRAQLLTPPPVKTFALAKQIPVFQPAKLDTERFKRETPDADLYIVAAYGKIIPKEIIALPRFGALNIHPSLLPRWRGASPIQYAILSGDTETGVTIIKMDEKMDHGPIVARRTLPMTNPKITYRELHDALAKMGAELLMETLPKWLKGEISPLPQDHTKATFTKILTREDGKIDWKLPAEEVERKIRALNPWPGSFTHWGGERLRIEKGEAVGEAPADKLAGYVWQKDTTLLVKTGQGSVKLITLTLAGKNTMTADSFLRGHKDFAGSVLT